MNINKKLEELNIELPPCPEPVAIYVPAILSENYVFVSGQTPKDGNKLVYKGKIGRDITIKEGKDAARICVLRCLSAIESVVGDLSIIERIIRITGYINSYDDFEDHSLVLNGASELLEKIFSKKGQHTRVAVGVNSLPGDAPIEIEMIAKIYEG